MLIDFQPAPLGRVSPGQRFGRLTAIKREDYFPGAAEYWRLRCDCGREFTARATWAQHASRCSARRCELPRCSTHPREYSSWQAMWARCTDPRSKGWRWYGAKGVAIDDRWKSFENFFADMGPRPPGRSIDRIDNGNYGPGLCRWATPRMQARNKRPRSSARAEQAAA